MRRFFVFVALAAASLPVSATADVVYFNDATSGGSTSGAIHLANEIILTSVGALDSITVLISDSVTGPVTFTASVYVGDGSPSTPPGPFLGSATVTADLPTSPTSVTFTFATPLGVPDDIVIGISSSAGAMGWHETFPDFGGAPSTGTWIQSWSESALGSGDWAPFTPFGGVILGMSVSTVAVPEPSSVLMLGACALGLYRRRRNAA